MIGRYTIFKPICVGVLASLLALALVACQPLSHEGYGGLAAPPLLAFLSPAAIRVHPQVVAWGGEVSVDGEGGWDQSVRILLLPSEAAGQEGAVGLSIAALNLGQGRFSARLRVGRQVKPGNYIVVVMDNLGHLSSAALTIQDIPDAEFPTRDPVAAAYLPAGFGGEEKPLPDTFPRYRRLALRGFGTTDGWDRWLFQVFWNEDLADLPAADVPLHIAEWYVTQLTAANIPNVVAEPAEGGVAVRFGSAPDGSFSQGRLTVGPPHTPYERPAIGDYAAGLLLELDRRPVVISPARELLDNEAVQAALPHPYAYGRVLNPVPVLEAPGSEHVVRTLSNMATWVAIREAVTIGDRTWYRIGPAEYVDAAAVALFTPSGFRGVELGPGMPTRVGFVYKEALNVRSRPGVADDNPPVAQLSRYDAVFIYEEAQAPDGLWYRIGPDRWVHAELLRVAQQNPRPVAIGPDEKWIDVDLAQQTVVAYEGDRMVYATLASTGMPWTPTVRGLFRIWAKLETGRMSLGSLESGTFYDLPEVPYIMYFHDNYALHGAYWHDSFGTPRSRGCVNLSPWDARWFFAWTTPQVPPGRRGILSAQAAEPGTWINVH